MVGQLVIHCAEAETTVITEMGDDASRGTVRVYSGTRRHGVSGKVHQNIQIGLGDIFGGREIVHFTDIGKTVGVRSKSVREGVVFARRAG